jgi:uncharacterized ion transporter superfamily protein YfcC
MRKLKFPKAQSLLLIIAVFVAVLTWIVPAGTYDTLKYDSDNNQFLITSVDTTYSMAGNQESLEKIQIKIPLATFTSGDIYKSINIPKTYKNLASTPQGFIELIMAPLKGI